VWWHVLISRGLSVGRQNDAARQTDGGWWSGRFVECGSNRQAVVGRRVDSSWQIVTKAHVGSSLMLAFSQALSERLARY
jgi:hypothetical protein